MEISDLPKIQMDIEPSDKLMPWMVRHCAWIHNHFQVKENGMTPYRSCRKKDYSGPLLEFAEICLCRDHDQDDQKLNPRWKKAVFVGKVDISDEFLVLTPQGGAKFRCVKRLSGEASWDREFLKICVGTPWNPAGKI